MRARIDLVKALKGSENSNPSRKGYSRNSVILVGLIIVGVVTGFAITSTSLDSGDAAYLESDDQIESEEVQEENISGEIEGPTYTLESLEDSYEYFIKGDYWNVVWDQAKTGPTSEVSEEGLTLKSGEQDMEYFVVPTLHMNSVTEVKIEADFDPDNSQVHIRSITADEPDIDEVPGEEHINRGPWELESGENIIEPELEEGYHRITVEMERDDESVESPKVAEVRIKGEPASREVVHPIGIDRDELPE